MKALSIHILLFFFTAVSVLGQVKAQEAERFTAKSPNDIFIGAIFEATAINKDAHQVLQVPLNPVTVSYSLPIISHSLHPSHENMLTAIRERLKTKSPLQANYSFSFSARELKSFAELPIYFGQDINLSKFLGLSSARKSKKTLMAVHLKQGFFSIEMDVPEEPLADPAALAQYDQSKLIYVNSIQFGRAALLTIESNLDYQTVQRAVNTALDKKPMDEKTRAVLAGCTMRLAAFGEDLPQLNTEDPLAVILDYMNKEVSADDFGYPVSFSASYLKDNSMFVNKFSVE